MGRHSRKGRGGSRDTAGIRTPHEAQPDPVENEPSYGDGWGKAYAEGTAGDRWGVPGHGVPGGRIAGHGAGAHGRGATPHGGVPHAREARGGHPEHREPGGGWGAYTTGQGPAHGGSGGQAGTSPGGPDVVAGPVGATMAGSGVRSGPRQEYVDAFDEDVFAAGAPGRRGPRTYGDVPFPAESPEADGAGFHVPGQRGPGEGAPPGEDGNGEGELPDSGGPFIRGHERSGKGRSFAGATAAAVTTVLAVVIAGHFTGKDTGGRAVGAASAQKKGHAAQHGGGATADAARHSAPLSFDEKMAKGFPLGRTTGGSGDFRAVGGHEKGPGGGQVVRYRVDVEKGVQLQGELFAEAVHKTLNDKRSWAHGGERSFERVTSGRPDFVITLASPKTTDVWCAKSGLDTSEDTVSCDSAATERVMINGYRWAQGAETFGADRLHVYRQMLINHEVGHRLGHGHVGCAEKGALAPVMMQQTKSLATDGRTCRPNAWPHPRT